MKIIKAIATILLFVVAAIIAIAYFTPDAAASVEHIPSPSVADLYSVDSDFFIRKNDYFGIRIADAVCLVIDENSFNVYEDGILDAKVTLPIIPENLAYVVLTNGDQWTAVQWEAYTEETIYVRVDITTLRSFQSLNPLWLIFFSDG